MHHVFDETPDEAPVKREPLLTTTVSHAPFDHNLGMRMSHDEKEQVNTSQYRSRGYGVGSLVTGPNDPDGYYKQPGHPLHEKADKGGRFKVTESIL